MTPPAFRARTQSRWQAVVAGTCVLGLLLVPFGRPLALASVTDEGSHGSGRARVPLDLRLSQSSATRVMADLTGSAQEADAEKPKSMDAQATAARKAAPGSAAAVKTEAPPPDKFGFVKDWPFWVIVGGVVIAGVGGYMLLHNSNDKAPCAPQFNAGCFP